MLGRRLAKRLLSNDELIGPSGNKEPLENLTLVDSYKSAESLPSDPRVVIINANICDNSIATKVIDDDVDTVFHFAAVVSGGAEADFNLGYQ